LAELKVKSLEEAQEKHDQFLAAENSLKSAESVLRATLAPGEKFEDLEKTIHSQAGQSAEREPEILQAELQSLLKELGAKKEGLVRSESVLKELVRRHAVSDSAALTRQMIKKQIELDSLENKLAALPGLPAGVSDLASFLESYRRMEEIVSSVGEELQKLLIELAELKARLPEQSAQDLQRVSREAAAAFDRELSHGLALRRVEEAIQAMEEKSSDIFGGFREEFEQQVAKLSGGKYQKAVMQESLPAIFQRKDGAAIPYAWLSSGTKDAFALALRLGMASHFLGSSDGFLMIDDPMVNMDPERQKIAGEMLKEFGKQKQVLVFTCHPAHAEMLGGNLIRI